MVFAAIVFVFIDTTVVVVVVVVVVLSFRGYCFYSHLSSLPLIAGNVPEISSRLVKVNYTTYFTCRAIGVPKPRIAICRVTGSNKKLINADKVRVGDDKGDRSYYCVAQNGFGPSIGKTLTIIGLCFCHDCCRALKMSLHKK